ncbi:MAG: sulfite exporter TauE/SafE family protein [Rickettsiales bacterium]|nr:sulfite exporter TauE/SafE family protein [Rickettsiales bacterium]
MSDFLLFVCIGFAAQLVDGAIGMAYGLIGTSTLLSIGIPPATASASIHAAEVFTTCASGLSHWRLKNIDWKLVRRLAPAGMVGGFVGAYILATNASGWLSLVIALYLTGMGAIVLRRGLRKFSENPHPPKHIQVLGFFGGLLDSIGGGGWGPLVTTNLMGQGTHPRMAIGSTSLSEFFVTFVISCTFMMTIGLELWPIITGLVIGGVLAAPIAAYAAKHLPAKILMVGVGCIIILLSIRTVIITGSEVFAS